MMFFCNFYIFIQSFSATYIGVVSIACYKLADYFAFKCIFMGYKTRRRRKESKTYMSGWLAGCSIKILHLALPCLALPWLAFVLS